MNMTGLTEKSRTASPAISESAPSSATFVEGQLEAVRPTQMTVGMAEVALKQQRWHELDSKGRIDFLVTHSFPAVIGPKGRRYITDHHHLGLALLREGVEQVRLNVQADLSKLRKHEFWMAMDYHQWVHPFDARGRRRPFADLPLSLLDLADDPFRSLAAAVRMCGGVAKEQSPYAEFLWADFFRHRISRSVLQKDPDQALAKSLSLAHDKAAMHLPGWSGKAPPATAECA